LLTGSSLKRLAPTLVAALLATVYVIVSPPSLDLAAHMLRAKLFSTEGLGIWNNWWYAGHHTPGYSVLYPAASAALTPQLAGAIAAVGSAALFEPLARRRFGEDAWLGAVWFGAATAVNLYTGRLAFAFGLLPGLAAVLALQRRRRWLAVAMAALTALASPVAALFLAVAGAADAVGTRRLGGLAVAIAALVPVGALAIAFPEGGTEPFTFTTLWPLLVIAAVTVWALPRDAPTLRAGVLLYTAGCLLSYAVPTAVGSNAARLGTLVAGPLAALILWRRRNMLLLAAALPLLYIQWQAPVRDLRTGAAVASASGRYYEPLLMFLAQQSGPPFRVEIPFTQFHWEAYEVAPRFPIARGWERQLDIKDNHLFYDGTLSAATYGAWLHELGIRFVAESDATLDYSGKAETKLLNTGLPYLHLVLRTRHWRVYAVARPTPIVSGAAALDTIGADSVTLTANTAGTELVRVHYTPYWALRGVRGCVEPAGDFTRVTFRAGGRARLVIDFSLGRIRARSPRCN
jgi:hypothetical protein